MMIEEEPEVTVEKFDEESVRKLSNGVLDALYDDPENLKTLPSIAVGILRKVKESDVFNCRRLKMSDFKARNARNFVRGTTFLDDFAKYLTGIPFSNSFHNVFVDLGCGDGECLLAASLVRLQPGIPAFRSIVGVELNHARVVEANVLQLVIEYLHPSAFPPWQVSFSDFLETKWTPWTLIGSQSEGSSPCRVVVYACATCYSDEVVEGIVQRFLGLPICSGSDHVLLLLDKELQVSSLRLVRSMEGIRTSWGEGCLREYQRQP